MRSSNGYELEPVTAWQFIFACGTIKALGLRTTTPFWCLMRIVLNVIGVLCLLAGCVWILQGINILPGSFMTGQTKWAIYGAILVVAGIGLLISAKRRRI